MSQECPLNTRQSHNLTARVVYQPRLFSYTVYCTYPIPFYAHTHFLSSIRSTLILYHVDIEALTASPSLYTFWVIQHFSNSLFVNIVKTL